MRSGCQVSAFLMIAQAGESAHASARTSQAGTTAEDAYALAAPGCARRPKRAWPESTPAGQPEAHGRESRWSALGAVAERRRRPRGISASASCGNPAYDKSCSAASAQLEPSYAINTFIVAAIRSSFLRGGSAYVLRPWLVQASLRTGSKSLCQPQGFQPPLAATHVSPWHGNLANPNGPPGSNSKACTRTNQG